MFKAIRNAIAKPRPADHEWIVETDGSWHLHTQDDPWAPPRVFVKAVADTPNPFEGIPACESRNLACPCIRHQKAREVAAALLWD